VINPTITCNICNNRIHWHPAAGADSLSLFQRGPIGIENSVLVEDESNWSAQRTEIHICRVCEQGLAAFFKNREAKT
jgi:hypothetical protein